MLIHKLHPRVLAFTTGRNEDLSLKDADDIVATNTIPQQLRELGWGLTAFSRWHCQGRRIRQMSYGRLALVANRRLTPLLPIFPACAYVSRPQIVFLCCYTTQSAISLPRFMQDGKELFGT